MNKCLSLLKNGENSRRHCGGVREIDDIRRVVLKNFFLFCLFNFSKILFTNMSLSTFQLRYRQIPFLFMKYVFLFLLKYAHAYSCHFRSFAAKLFAHFLKVWWQHSNMRFQFSSSEFEKKTSYHLLTLK